MSASIEVKGLRKSFGKVAVLKDVNFSVKPGGILAILGPNGAGKTTIVNILSTLMPQDEGKATIAGFDTLRHGAKVRERIGLTGQFAAVDGYLSARENLRLIGRLYHLDDFIIGPRVDDLIDRFDLTAFADRPARTYSGGMKRRLDLAMSLVADPPILFLDEPTTGLDPRSRLKLWYMIKDLAHLGHTILLTTQQIEEADFLADDIIVIDHGMVIAEGSPNKLKVDIGIVKLELAFKTAEEMHKVAAMFRDTTPDEGNLSVSMPAKYGVDTLKATLQYLEKVGIRPETAALRRPTLDDVFLTLTGHETDQVQEEKK